MARQSDSKIKPDKEALLLYLSPKTKTNKERGWKPPTENSRFQATNGSQLDIPKQTMDQPMVSLCMLTLGEDVVIIWSPLHTGTPKRLTLGVL